MVLQGLLTARGCTGGLAQAWPTTVLAPGLGTRAFRLSSNITFVSSLPYGMQGTQAFDRKVERAGVE